MLLIGTFAVWRRDVLRSWGFPLAVAIAAVLMVPNLVWEAGHGWTSVHFFVNPPPSGSDETRLQFVLNILLLVHPICVPVAVAGVAVARPRQLVRPLGWTVVGTVVAYFVLGGKSYYTLPVLVFALAAGAIPLERWATRRRLVVVGALFVVDHRGVPAAHAAGAAAAHGRPARNRQGARRLPVGDRLARVRASGASGSPAART